MSGRGSVGERRRIGEEWGGIKWQEDLRSMQSTAPVSLWNWHVPGKVAFPCFLQDDPGLDDGWGEEA